MKIFRYFKIKIRLFILYFYIRTMNYITNDLHNRILLNKDNNDVLNEIFNEIKSLKLKYPNEPELNRAEIIVTRLLIMKK